MINKRILSSLILFLIVSALEVQAQTKPVRVFILAGQSNMEGHARVDTFDYIGDDLRADGSSFRGSESFHVEQIESMLRGL